MCYNCKVNILWLTNIKPHIISRSFGEKENIYGGWIDDISLKLLKNNHITFLFPSNNIESNFNGSFSYYSFKTSDDYLDIFKNVFKNNNFDIIHIWGTEYKYSYDLFEISKLFFKNNNVIISLQGIINEIIKVYDSFLPKSVISNRTIKEILCRQNISDQKNDFIDRSNYELLLLKSIHNVIGRTEWDYNAVKSINDNVNYYKCNESMRDIFYSEPKWEYNTCNKNSIFVSQSNYPIKGFHLLLEAVSKIINKYRDLVMYTTGNDLFSIPFYRLNSYQYYIKKLILKYNLKNNIKFLGFLDKNHMKEMYLKTNIFVSPSTIENSSNSISEAMLTGTPIIASNVGGTNSLIRDKIDGLLYKVDDINCLADLIDKCFSSKDLIEGFSKNSKVRANKLFDRDKNYNDLINIYNSVIKENNI